MERYDYEKVMIEDIKEYIKENILLSEFRGNRDGLLDKLQDDLWIEDSVTGNASGSYFFNAYKAEEALCHNLDLLADACEEFELDDTKYLRKPEAADVTIRCYLLGTGIIEQALTQVEREKGIDLDDEVVSEYYEIGNE